MFETILNSVTPPAGKVLRLTFPPTRSVITGVKGLGPPSPCGAWYFAGLHVVLRGPPVPGSLPLAIQQEGEPLKKPMEAVLELSEVSLANVPQDTDLMKTWYEQRAMLARLSNAQRFFFDLDCETERAVLDHRTKVRREIGEDEKLERIRLLKSVKKLLNDRLVARLNQKMGAQLPQPDNYTAQDIRDCSALFRKVATRSLLETGSASEWELLGQACGRFAAGDLCTAVVVGSPGSEMVWRVTTPDSAQILMFAELAFVARDLQADRDMWDAILPNLVRMQWYYWARCSAGRKKFDEYGEPANPLQDHDRIEVERLIPVGLGAQPHLLECKIYEKLVDYVSAF